MENPKPRKIHDAVRPRLINFQLLKFHADNNPEFAFGEILASLKEDFEVGIDESKEHEGKFVVHLKVIFKGNWKQKSTKKVVIKCDAEYLGVFFIDKQYPMDKLQADLKELTFTEILMAQVYPLANSHLIEQLRLMGLNAKKPVGFQFTS